MRARRDLLTELASVYAIQTTLATYSLGMSLPLSVKSGSMSSVLSILLEHSKREQIAMYESLALPLILSGPEPV